MLSEKQKSWLEKTSGKVITISLMKTLIAQRIKLDHYLEALKYWLEYRGFKYIDEFGWYKEDEINKMGLKKVYGIWKVSDPQKMNTFLEKRRMKNIALTNETNELAQYIDQIFN